MVGAINKLYGKTWELNGATYENGIFTFPANGFAMANCTMENPIAGHLYYGSVEQKAPSGASFDDGRFEWWKGDAAGELMVFAYMDGTNDQWVRQSAVFRAEADTSGSWIMRNFTVNGTAEAYRRNPIIIDLTAAFGAGNEPTAAWVDANMIPSANNDVIFFDVLSAENAVEDRRRMMMGEGGFPSEPSSYELIGTYTTTQTWYAPENGYFQIEVFGASGSSGSSGGYSRYSGGSWIRFRASGGGGGGGAFASSRVKLNKGDVLVLSVGASGSSSSVNFQSSFESYDIITVTSGSSGGNAHLGSDYSSSSGGSGGSGGVASGGNYSNLDGGTGSSGSKASGLTSLSGASGGSSAVDGGNVGATSPSVQGTDSTTYPANSGSAGFIKIYRGDTN